MPLEPGASFGRYRIETLLGQGGMGEVFRAIDTLLHRSVAIKILRSSTKENATEAATDNILREARDVAAIQHPNIVSLFDFGEHDGVFFITMEFVEGQSLRSFIARPDVPLEQRVRWLADIGRALDAAHRAGIVHRDVKPENIMINGAGMVKVLDFGIGQRMILGNAGDVPTSSLESPRGGLAGTPRYMAPEQVRGKDIDGRTDQFAWGVVAYELCTGKMPWNAIHDRFDVFYSIVQESPKPPRQLNPDIAKSLDRVIRRALAKEPMDRFASMNDAVLALEQSMSIVRGMSARLPEPRASANPAVTRQDQTVEAGNTATDSAHRSMELVTGAELLSPSVSTTNATVPLGVNRKVVERRIQAREKSRRTVQEALDQARGLVDAANFGAAIPLLQRAVAMVDPASTAPEIRTLRFELHRLLAVCYRSVHGWLSAQAQVEQEAAFADGEGVVDPAALNLLLFGIWTTQLMTLQLESARATAQDMLERAHLSGSADVHAEAHVALANTLFWLGDSEEVRACLARSGLVGDSEVERTGPQGFDLVALALTFDGVAAFHLGAFARAQEIRPRLLACGGGANGNSFSRAIALHGAAWLACLFEDNEALGVLANELESLGRTQGFVYYRGIGQFQRGCHRAGLGDHALALDDMREGYDVHMLQNGGKLAHSLHAWKRGATLLAAGRAHECEVLISAAIDITLEHHDRAYLSELLCVGGLARAALNDAEGAEEGLRSALSTALAIGSVPARLYAAVHLAHLLADSGRRGAARKLLQKSTSGVERTVPYPGLERALQLLEVLEVPGSP